MQNIVLFFSCTDESGQYRTTCVVERVIFLGLGQRPTFVTACSKGNELTFILLHLVILILLHSYVYTWHI